MGRARYSFPSAPNGKKTPANLRARTESKPKHDFPSSSAINQELLQSLQYTSEFSPQDFLPRQVHDGYPHPIAQVTAIDLSVSRLPLHLAILAISADLLNNVVFAHQKEAEDDVDGDPGPGAET